MSEIKRVFAQLFSNPMPAVKSAKIPEGLLDCLDAPGVNVKPPENLLPVIAAPINDQPAPVTTPRCHSCGQVLPQTVVEVAAVVEQVPSAPNGPADQSDDRRAIDKDEEARTDLPMRSPKRIAFLLQSETEEQTQSRILNDGARYRHRRSREGGL